MSHPQGVGLMILIVTAGLAWIVLAAVVSAVYHRNRIALAMLFGPPLVIGFGLLLFGCAAQAEPLDPANFPPSIEDAGPDADVSPGAASCRKRCYDLCLPNAHSDTAARDCVWVCNESCEIDGWSPDPVTPL